MDNDLKHATKDAVNSNGNQSWSSELRQRCNFLRSRLARKFASTSRFVVSSKVWLRTIPTRDCDVLVTFPAGTLDHTLMWLLSRLRTRTPELAVHVRHHSHTEFYGFYLTATYENLLKGAEELAIRKPVKPEYGGGMKEFVYEDQEFFVGVDMSSTFLTSQERQNIVQHMLYNLRATDDDHLGSAKFRDGQAIVPILLSKGVIKQVFPLHNNDDLTYLQKNWMTAFFSKQPLEKIREYFGVKIAMYFAYLGHYTVALLWPAIFGVFLWLLSGSDQYSDDISFVVFAFFNVLWSTLYLEHWKRRSAELAYIWGTLDKEDELLVEPRPLFIGTFLRSPVTGRMEPYYPAYKRNLFRYFVSLPVVLFCLSVVFATMWWIFEIQDWIDHRVDRHDLPYFVKFFPKILLALSIGVLDEIYKRIAYWLNNMENYRLQEKYDNNLIIKLVLFQFVNSFLSLFYIAFYLQDMDGLREQLAALLITRQVMGNFKEALLPYILEKLKLYRIGYEMTSGMSAHTLERQMREMVGEKHGKPPSVIEEEEDETVSTSGILKVEKKYLSAEGKVEDGATGDAVDEALRKEIPEKVLSKKRYSIQDVISDVDQVGPTLTQAEMESAMKSYEDTFEDYLEMFIQYGYVTLFSSAFPMAAMCALLNNIIEIRSDAFKLCMTLQRPFGQRVENIGIWQDALELMSVVAVMVNCALIGMSGLTHRLFPNLTMAERIAFIILLEHIILGLKFGIAYAIPDIPHWVAEEKATLEFLRRDALKRLQIGNTSVLASTPKRSVSTESSGDPAPPANPIDLESLEQDCYALLQAARDESSEKKDL